MINILQFSYGKNKGTAKEDEVFASPLAYQGMDVNYTSEWIHDEEALGDGSTTDFTLKWPGAIDGTIVAEVNGTPTTVTFDATTNAVTFGTAPASGAVIKFTYKYDNTTAPVEVPTLKMDIKSLPITTQARKLSAVWAFDAAYELEKELIA